MKLDYTFIKALAIAKKKGGGGGGSSPKTLLEETTTKSYGVTVSKGGGLGVEIFKLEGLKVGVPARITVKCIATKSLNQAGTGSIGVSERTRIVTTPIATYESPGTEIDTELIFIPTAETMYINLYGVNKGTTGYTFLMQPQAKFKVEQWS